MSTYPGAYPEYLGHLLNKELELERGISAIENYNKYLDALIDNGFRHNFHGSCELHRYSWNRQAFQDIYEISVSKSPALVLPLNQPVMNLEVWLTDGARAPVPPRVELPETDVISKFVFFFQLQDSGLQWEFARVEEMIAKNRTLFDTYNQRVDEFCQRQEQVHADVLATAQDIQQRITECRKDGDLSGLAVVMQDLMAFLFRRVSLVGMRDTRKHMVLAVESRTAFVQVEFPDCSGVDMYVGEMASGKPKFASAAAKKKLIQASLYSTAIYFGHLVGRFGLPEVFDTVVVNVEQDWFDPATGHPRNGIVASLQAKREVFANLDLEKVEPVACFRELKGLSTPNMNAPTPIRPIMQLQTTDARFVESRDVDLEVDPQSNLAAMGWE